MSIPLPSMKNALTFLLLIATASLADAAPSRAVMEKARSQMIERLPEIENLWNRGLTGESNEGLVAARSTLTQDQTALIQAENRDRAILYAYVANRAGSDVFTVARERARQIRLMGKDRLWIQTPSGEWIRK